MIRVLAAACLLCLIQAVLVAADVQTTSCSAALLIIDVQNAWLTDRALTTDGLPLPEKAAALAAAAREEGVPVIFVIDVAYRFRFSDEQLELAEPLEVLAGDYVVEKLHPNGFLETSLEPLLQSLGVTTLFISGYATNECVKETLEGGREGGFEIVIVDDGHSGGRSGTRASAWNRIWSGNGLQVTPSWEIDFASLCDSSIDSPIQGTLLFDTNRDGNWEIYSIGADGSDPTRLTDSRAQDYGPWPSPDGSRIVFFSRPSGINHIYTMDIDGQNVLKVPGVPGPSAGPVWSPDGSQFVFVSFFDGDAEICTASADGTDFRQLTDNAGGDFEPTWPPDGEHIGWSGESPDGSHIFTMHIDGSDVRQLTVGSSFNGYAHWSPDGARVAFCSDRTGAWEIYAMDPDGSNVVQLTSFGSRSAAPRWSPDGTRIVFQSDRDGDTEIYIMNADGSDLRQVTDNTAEDARPVWLPRTDS